MPIVGSRGGVKWRPPDGRVSRIAGGSITHEPVAASTSMDARSFAILLGTQSVSQPCDIYYMSDTDAGSSNPLSLTMKRRAPNRSKLDYS